MAMPNTMNAVCDAVYRTVAKAVMPHIDVCSLAGIASRDACCCLLGGVLKCAALLLEIAVGDDFDDATRGRIAAAANSAACEEIKAIRAERQAAIDAAHAGEYCPRRNCYRGGPLG